MAGTLVYQQFTFASGLFTTQKDTCINYFAECGHTGFEVTPQMTIFELISFFLQSSNSNSKFSGELNTTTTCVKLQTKGMESQFSEVLTYVYRYHFTLCTFKKFINCTKLPLPVVVLLSEKELV